jgi:hypothetical protein
MKKNKKKDLSKAGLAYRIIENKADCTRSEF